MRLLQAARNQQALVAVQVSISARWLRLFIHIYLSMDSVFFSESILLIMFSCTLAELGLNSYRWIWIYLILCQMNRFPSYFCLGSAQRSDGGAKRGNLFSLYKLMFLSCVDIRILPVETLLESSPISFSGYPGQKCSSWQTSWAYGGNSQAFNNSQFFVSFYCILKIFFYF